MPACSLQWPGHLDFHESLLELLGVARISRDLVDQHLATLIAIFDRAKHTIKTPFSFATDISENAGPMTIDASLEMIERGYYREAMFSEGHLVRRSSRNEPSSTAITSWLRTFVWLPPKEFDGVALRLS